MCLSVLLFLFLPPPFAFSLSARGGFCIDSGQLPPKLLRKIKKLGASHTKKNLLINASHFPSFAIGLMMSYDMT